MTIAIIVVPIFLLIGAGYLFRRAGIIKEEWSHVLNSFVYYVALPALIIASFWNIRWGSPDLLRLIGINLVFLVGFAVALGVALLFLPTNRRIKASIFLAAMVGNSIYMGFPLGEQAFGPEAFDRVIGTGTLFLVFGILISVVAIELFWETKRLSRYFRDFVTNPLSVGVVIGIIGSLIGKDSVAVEVVRGAIGMVAAIAAPAGLIALGSFLYGRFEKEVVWFSVLAAGIKLIVFPALIFFVDVLVGGGIREVGTSMLLAAMPTAVSAFVVAEEFDLELSLVATTLIVSTVGSIFTVPLVLSLWV